jgi:biopolymer transport protein ExbD
MKQLIQIVVILLVVLGTVAVVIITAEPQVKVPAQQSLQQPQREKYVPPEWVVNERGQRCIKQGETITCG